MEKFAVGWLDILKGEIFLKVILIDDEWLAIESLKKTLLKIGGIQIVGTYTNPMDALRHFNDQVIDVVFLDNEMGQYHGIQIAQEIMTKHSEVQIVFVTAHEQFAIDAFAVRAVDYLLKPVSTERLKETLHRLSEQKKPKPVDKQVSNVQNEDVLRLNVMGNAMLQNSKEREIKWRTQKVKELFLYLWHHTPEAVHRTRIMEDLWPEQFKEKATQLMHTTLYQLRKALRGSGFKAPIKLVNEKYVLEVKVVSDLETIEQLLNRTQMTNEQIEKAILLYQGDFIEEENYSWAIQKQTQLKALFLTTLETFIQEEIKNNHLTQLVEKCLEKLVELEPYNEQYIYLFIDYHEKKENPQKVIQLVQRFEEVWVRELGINTPKEIIRIYRKYEKQLK